MKALEVALKTWIDDPSGDFQGNFQCFTQEFTVGKISRQPFDVVHTGPGLPQTGSVVQGTSVLEKGSFELHPLGGDFNTIDCQNNASNYLLQVVPCLFSYISYIFCPIMNKATNLADSCNTECGVDKETGHVSRVHSSGTSQCGVTKLNIDYMLLHDTTCSK